MDKKEQKLNGPLTSDESFENLVANYERRIFNLIYRIIGNYDDASDLTVDTFLRAYESFSKFRGASKPYTWLYRIAVNLCKNRLKQLSRQRELALQQLESFADVGPMRSEPVDWSQSPEKLVQVKELQEHVQKAVDSLPEDFKIVVVLKELHDLSYDEIAQVIGSSRNVVKIRLFRAREMLRKKLRPYLEAK